MIVPICFGNVCFFVCLIFIFQLVKLYSWRLYAYNFCDKGNTSYHYSEMHLCADTVDSLVEGAFRAVNLVVSS